MATTAAAAPGQDGASGTVLGDRRWAVVWAYVFLVLFVAFALCPPLYMLAFGRFPSVTIAASWPLVLAAGLAVGIGTRMGSGCTSGHGILGLARFSKRSFAATATFLLAGVAMATLMEFLR